MDDPGAQSSSSGLRAQHGGYGAAKSVGTARSRSPAGDRRDADTRSPRRYRERSRSPRRKEGSARRNEGKADGGDARSYRSRRSRDGRHRHRRQQDEDSAWGRGGDGRTDGESAWRGRHRRRDDGRERSPAPRSQDYWDDRDVMSWSGSRYSSSHQCIDSTLSQEHSRDGAQHQASTTANPPTIRLPPPETERHYASHRCHHHDHNRSPSRSTTSHSHGPQHQPQRHSSPSYRHAGLPKLAALPYGARPLSRWDFAAFEPLFAHYLEKHKHIRMADLDEESVRDRWKSFVSKWNACELEKTWYEPDMFLRVVRLRALEEARVRAAASLSVPPHNRRDGEPAAMTPPLTGVTFASEMMESVVSSMTRDTGSSTDAVDHTPDDDDDDRDDDDDDDEYAPPPPPPPQAPGQPPTSASLPPPTANDPKPGPTIPTLADLELRRTLDSEAREAHLSSLRLARRAERVAQSERLDELLVLPRAEAGTRERRLEKRRLATEAMREFASGREAGGGGAAEEVPDAELLGGGGGGGGADDYRRVLEGMRRRRTEREVRREEVRRAREAEREARVREARAREEERLGELREMARARFG